MTSINTTSSVPQGFSIYQSQLGAPLEFLPALGTKELDDLVNAYIPGPGAMQQKRAQVSLEFLTHSQQTGQSFKYFVVSDFAVTNPDSPSLMPSPAQGSSSFTVSPVASDWDWSSVSGGNATGSSRSGSSRKSATASTRHQTAADFSHMPGMKIMTKEGLDVTNSASRGSKTKEQRDHAHLMRIIKACESCRKKKIRCDPSHKKRVAAAASQTTAKASKKTKVAMPAVSQKQVSLPPAFPGANTILPTAPSLDLDFFPTFEPVDDLAMPNEASASWEDLIHFPQDMDTDYDFFFDPEGHLTPSISNSSPSSSNSASSKSISPESLTTHVVSDLEGSQVSSIDIFATGELHNASAPQLPYLGVVGGHTNYTDFNLYSPASSFSEDERMLSATSSTLSTSADGVSHVRSPPDRPNAPCDETTFCSNSEQSDAVLLDGQLRWASSNTWTHSIEPVDVLACTGTSSHGALAMESVNADRLLGADILNLSGQHHTVLGDQPANAIDRSHVHNQPVMLTGPTASVSSSISAVSRPALNGPVSELPSHIQTGNAHVQNGVVQTMRLRTSDAAISSTTAGSDPVIQMATSSSPLSSAVRATTSQTSELSLAAILLSSHSAGLDATQALLRELATSSNDQVERGHGISGDSLLLASQMTSITEGASVRPANADRDLVEVPPLAPQLLDTSVGLQVEDHGLVDSSLSTSVTVARNNSAGCGYCHASEVRLASSTLQKHRGNASSIFASTVQAGPRKMEATILPLPGALIIMGVCLATLLLATKLDIQPLAAMTVAMAMGTSFLRVLNDAPRGSSSALKILSGIQSGPSHGGSVISRQISLFSTRMSSSQAINVW